MLRELNDCVEASSCDEATLHHYNSNLLPLDGLIGIFSDLETDASVGDLRLTGYLFDKRSSESLAQLLDCNPDIQTLTLTACKFQAPAFSNIMSAVTTNQKSLHTLALHRIKLETIALSQILHAFEYNCRLCHLDLSFCDLGDTQTVKLFMLYNEKVFIKLLNLSYNRITCQGLSMMASKLREETFLRELTLLGNNIGDSGRERLFLAVRDNPSHEVKLNFLDEALALDYVLPECHQVAAILLCLSHFTPDNMPLTIELIMLILSVLYPAPCFGENYLLLPMAGQMLSNDDEGFNDYPDDVRLFIQEHKLTLFSLPSVRVSEQPNSEATEKHTAIARL